MKSKVLHKLARGSVALTLAGTLMVPAAAFAGTAEAQGADQPETQRAQLQVADASSTASVGSNDSGILKDRSYSATVSWTSADGDPVPASLSKTLGTRVTVSRTDTGYAVGITPSSETDLVIDGIKNADGTDAPVVSPEGVDPKTYRIYAPSIDGRVSVQLELSDGLAASVQRSVTVYFEIDRSTLVERGLALPTYRLYNPYTGEHFYTEIASERDGLVTVGWRDEGVGWYAPLAGVPVYRLYNPYAGEHHYTVSAAERDMLQDAGWNYEGIGWRSAPMHGIDSVPLYREYNPNQYAWNHNFTENKNEHDYLVESGWRDEGIAWYGFRAW